MRTTKARLTRRLAAMSVTAAMAVAGGACSDRDGISEEEFAREVNALCAAEHKQVDALFSDFPEEPTPERIQALIADFTPILREYRDDVKDVGPPESRRDDYEKYTDHLDEIVASYEAASDDVDAAQALFNEDDSSLGDIEADLGLDVCASR